jgi:hypothetical protein
MDTRNELLNAYSLLVVRSQEVIHTDVCWYDVADLNAYIVRNNREDPEGNKNNEEYI